MAVEECVAPAAALLLVAAPENIAAWETVALTLGWISFVLWSVSFYPQIYTNWRRKAVTGLSFDYEMYNVVGFSSLALYNAMLFWNANVRQQYCQGHENNEFPQVAVNDVFFGIHALALTLVHVAQICIYDRGNQKVSYFAITLVAALLLGALGYGIVVATGGALLLDWLYYVSYIKLVVTFVKYFPQIYLNWARKSTVGWNIVNILLDLTGGILSLSQLLIDCWVDDDWEGISGNAVKFGLSILSMFFDVIFLLQHFVFYTDRSDRSARAPSALSAHADDDEEVAKLIPSPPPADRDSPSIQDTTTSASPSASASLRSRLWHFLAWFTRQTHTAS